jgi:hypothetical protein
MPATVKQMLEAANAIVPKISSEQAAEMINNGNTMVEKADPSQFHTVLLCSIVTSRPTTIAPDRCL